jgi:SAM-dependent methyltransferase
MASPHHEHGPGVAWEDRYTNTPPWDIGRPQPAFAALADRGAWRGRVLDAGCGTGEHALLAAALGLDATGVDLAPRALAAAERKARERGLTARFLRHDARALADLGQRFDTVLDCGLFHIFTGSERTAYVAGLRAVLSPGGRYFMLGFSDRQPDDQFGRHRMTRQEVEAAFTDGWRIDSLEPATIDSIVHPDGIRAWLLAATAIRHFLGHPEKGRPCRAPKLT